MPFQVLFVFKLNYISKSKGDVKQPVFKKGRNEISQTEERQTLYNLTYMWNLRMSKTKTRTHRCRERIGGCQRQGMKTGESGQQVQTSSYKSWGCNIEHFVSFS